MVARVFVVGLLGVFATGCPDRGIAVVPINPSKELQQDIPVQDTRDVDLLFVIDRSGSMRDEQEALRANFGRFIDVLETIPGGLPNLRIGVITSDVGVGFDESPMAERGCDITGGGELRATRQTGGGNCLQAGATFLTDQDDGSGNRVRNYDGSLEAAFSCMADRGINGCGFEQPLEAVRLAVNNNPGFLRDNAFLGVIIVTDEDDCSSSNISLFSRPDVGPDDYRCFADSVDCSRDTLPARADASLGRCRTAAAPRFLRPVDFYSEFLKGLKADPGKVVVAGVLGSPDPDSDTFSVQVNRNGDLTIDVAKVCGDAANDKGAEPAFRIATFFDQFPGRSAATSICDNDFSTALTQIAALLKRVIGTPCFETATAQDENGEPLCNVEELRPNVEPELVNRCSAGLGLPCWRAEVDLVKCPNTPTHLKLVVDRADEALVETTLELRCEVP